MIGFVFQLVLIAISVFLGAQYANYSITIRQCILVFIPWLISIWATHKNRPKYEQKKAKYVLAPFFRGYITFIVLVVLLFFIFDENNSIFKNILLSLLAYALVEFTIYFLLVKIKATKEIKKQEKKIKKYSQEKFEIKNVQYIDTSKIDFGKINLRKELFSELYKNDGYSTDGQCLVNVFNANNVNLFVANEKVNNLQNINSYFSKVFNIVATGGFFIIGYKDLDDVETEIETKKGLVKFVRKVKYYIFDRAFPKLPILNKIHAILTNRKNKVISKTEVWGRLIYNGFDVKKEVKDNDITYLIAQKDRTPSENPNPSYSPLIRLNRVSLYGNLIKIYKDKVIPTMPIGANTLMTKYNIPEGKTLGNKLKIIEEAWVENGFTISEKNIQKIAKG